MRVELTDLSPVKKKMSVEVETAEVAKETDGVLQSYRAKARIPGFRPGKAPMSMIRTRYAKELAEEVQERLVSRFFFAAAREKQLDPIGDPAIDDVSHEEGGPLSFSTTFEVLPRFELKGFEGVELRRTKPEVTDEELGQALEQIRQSKTTLIGEEGREAVEGDVIFADVHGEPEDGEPFDRERMPIELGAENNLPKFNEELAGAKAGDQRELEVTYPDDYGAAELAGKSVKFRIRVHEVKIKQLPELDDDFAKDLGDFEDLAALKARVREDLDHRKQHEERHAAEQAVLEKVLLENPVVLPDLLVDREVVRRLEDIARNMIMQGMKPEEADVDWAELRKRQTEPARQSVHARLVLDEVARVKQLTVEKKEVDARIRAEAQRSGESVDALKKRLKEGGGMEALMRQMVRERSLDYLTSVANIQYSD